MSNLNKLEFRLVPTKGVTSNRGFRAELLRKGNVPLDVEHIIAEAQAKGAFRGISPSLAHSDIKTFFDTMIENVLRDGKTRKLDGYLELSLKIHGNFENKTDDFDEDLHSLDLAIKPLSAFRRKSKFLQPVNVNRIKQFRLSYITAADGLHKNHQVVLGQDFIIRGSNLTLPETKFSGVSCMVHQDDGSWLCATAPILEKSDSEIRCSWPVEYGEFTLRHKLIATVTKGTSSETLDISREIHAGILPA